MKCTCFLAAEAVSARDGGAGAGAAWILGARLPVFGSTAGFDLGIRVSTTLCTNASPASVACTQLSTLGAHTLSCCHVADKDRLTGIEEFPVTRQEMPEQV